MEEAKGREDEDEDVKSYWTILRKKTILDLESRSTRSLTTDNLLWKKLRDAKTRTKT